MKSVGMGEAKKIAKSLRLVTLLLPYGLNRRI